MELENRRLSLDFFLSWHHTELFLFSFTYQRCYSELWNQALVAIFTAWFSFIAQKCQVLFILD